ncbi:MAG TPA: hypothetical protein VK034_30460 [Enhygromyxa sp.]|nr:hypothetical protein [Enhygromyxa sp.]
MHVVAKLPALACAIALLTPDLARAYESAPPDPPPPCIEDKLSLTGTGLWSGLKDSTVELTLKNDAELRGTIVAQDTEQLAVARTSDGSVVSVPKDQVKSVRLVAIRSEGDERGDLPPQALRPRDDGRKAYAAGVAMLSIGVPFGVAGTATAGVLFFAPYVYLPVLLPGIGMIVGGSIALKRSFKLHDTYRKAWGLPKTGKLQLAPALDLGREGGQVGLVMRF